MRSKLGGIKFDECQENVAAFSGEALDQFKQQFGGKGPRGGRGQGRFEDHAESVGESPYLQYCVLGCRFFKDMGRIREQSIEIGI